MGGGHMQQGKSASAAPAAVFDHHHGSVPGGDAGDAIMARWLQSAGLQHLASPLASADQRFLPNLLLQGYGPQTAEEKQRLFKLLRNLNFNGESGSESYNPMNTHSFGTTTAADGFYSPELRGEFGAGLMDLHAMDDMELLSEHVMPEEPFETSPFLPSQAFEDDFDIRSSKQQGPFEGNTKMPSSDKETSAKESNVAKIKVVVRKRPLNKKEVSRKEEDIVSVHENSYLTVHEPKLKVDLTAYVEKHEFAFDAVIDEHVSNDEVYRVTVEPIIPTIFKHTKATCFAYGQTGSGKTFTMKPLPLRAVEDIVRLLRHPSYFNQRFKLWLSYFEIYGGKLYDLLSDRRKLCMREDGRQQVCIVGLQEFEVSDVRIVNEFIEKGNAARSTGSTGANEESSRSHAILQLAIKKHKEIIDTRRPNDSNEAKSSGKVIGKISFIDLAGSERGADTTDNDRQTRIEGAEINKSLLALKECIRALDNDQIHIPFRGSKLTEVLRDSFVGNSKTVMISCISPNAGSCEHTLNTLRYADRVKSLSKGGSSRKDSGFGSSLTSSKELLSSSFPFADEAEDLYERNDFKPVETRKIVENSSYNSATVPDRNPAGNVPSYLYKGRVEAEAKPIYGLPSSHQPYSSAQASSMDGPDEEKSSKVFPPLGKAAREEKTEKKTGWPRNSSHKQSSEQEILFTDGETNALIEEEEALIAAHRKEIENTMEIVRGEMNLLAEVDRPGSQIDSYVSQLSFLLSRKAAGLVSLQSRLARFQHRIKEHELLSRRKGSR